MQVFTIVFIGFLTINPATAQEPAATESLESQRAAAEESWQKATDVARSIAANYRNAAAAEPTDKQSIERLKSDLEAAVTKAFEAQTQLQSIRLQLALEFPTESGRSVKCVIVRTRSVCDVRKIRKA